LPSYSSRRGVKFRHACRLAAKYQHPPAIRGFAGVVILAALFA